MWWSTSDKPSLNSLGAGVVESTGTDDVAGWIAERRVQSGLVVEQVPLQACDDWRFEDGALRHHTGRFFSVVGVRCHGGGPHLQGLSLPMIDQPEIGVLGFVVRRGAAGWEWLLQAKTEPGNIRGTQVGPSVQATRSNYLRVHGGQATEMIGLFTDAHGTRSRISDIEQSEQGDRFLGKYNRNAVVEVAPDHPAPTQGAWRWFGACALRQALTQDFVFNTDARSVLCCTDWSLLCPAGDSKAFGRWRGLGGWGEQLLASNEVPLADSGLEAALTQLDATRRTSTLRLERVALDALPHWRCDAWAIESEQPGMDPVVRTFRVHSTDREVRDWCQPLLTNRSEGRVVLACARRHGALHFFIPAREEPGFAERAQFGPSLLTGLGHTNADRLRQAIDQLHATTHISVRQSDEGGRFKDSVARYEIIEIAPDDTLALETAGAWVTLSALRHMSSVRGLLSNELRSCISLLLNWA